MLMAIWSSTIALHLLSWGSWFVLGLTTLMGFHLLRVFLARPLPLPDPLSTDPDNPIQNDDASQTETHKIWPYISLLVSAKNEEAVIGNLVKNLCELDYPATRYDLWFINDNSTDGTAEQLDRLAQEYPQLNVLHRGADASGGKSGALNQVLPLTQGDIIAVFDADAQVPKDLLKRVVPLFSREQVGAVQVRKAIANASSNFLTRGQTVEMIVDGFFQQQRVALGGIGELRGNGQFVRRLALERCGGWNEETITDDLDLTLRLHLDGWNIDFLNVASVEEEGVTRPIGLWHQRNRWAEGGYQRYLDYWRLLLRNRLGPSKTLDLFVFWMFQYFLPTAAVPDFLMAVAGSRLPVLGPVGALMVTFSALGMFLGLRRLQKQSLLTNLFQTLRGLIYMFHWFVVVGSTTARISVRPKRLKWVKTVHQGNDEETSHEVQVNVS